MVESVASEPGWIEANGRSLAHKTTGGQKPHVVFLCGFRSDMEGSKALALEAHCGAGGQGFTRFDYSGHGISSGRFEDGSIGDWSEDAIAIIDQVTEGPVVLVGSSMGGWIMALAARARSERVAGLVGIAAAPDFTLDLIWSPAKAEVRRAIQEDGVFRLASEYDEEPTPITKKLIEDGAYRLVLRDPLPIRCPVHLIHGQRDPDVPWRTSLRLAEHIESEDVTVELVKDAEHRLSRDNDIARILAATDRLSAKVDCGAA